MSSGKILRPRNPFRKSTGDNPVIVLARDAMIHKAIHDAIGALVNLCEACPGAAADRIMSDTIPSLYAAVGMCLSESAGRVSDVLSVLAKDETE